MIVGRDMLDQVQVEVQLTRYTSLSKADRARHKILAFERFLGRRAIFVLLIMLPLTF